MTPPDLPPLKRLRIAVLNRHFSATGGGAERYSIAMVEHLAARHDIHVFAQQIQHSWPGVTYHTVSKPLNRPRWVNQLWYATATWWVTRRGFDVVHSHENTWHGRVQTMHVLPVKYNRLHGLSGWRLATRWLGMLTSPRLLAYLALEHWRFSLCTARVIVVTSQSMVQPMREAYPASASALTVITPGVERVWGAATSTQKSDARIGLDLPAEGFCILFVGNDYRKKGLTALILALVQLPAHCYVAVVGNPGQIPQFKAQADAAGVGQKVHFLGALQDVHPAYQAADCLTHPTLEDTFAMVVLEAMAHGLAVVVSAEKHCGIAGLLTDGQHALLLDDPRQPDALAAALTRCVDEPALRASLARAAQDFAQQYLWSRLAAQQEVIYLDMACRSAPS